MKFRNAFHILTDNFSNVYKMLLFRFITGLLFAGLAFLILSRGLNMIFESAEAKNIVKIVEELFRELGTGRPDFNALIDFRDAFLAGIKDFLYMLGSNVDTLIGALIEICVVYLAMRFLNGTATFAVGSILSDKLESYSKTTFASAYFKNLKRSTLYHLIYVPVSFLYDVLSLAGCWFFFFYTPSFLPLWGILTILIGLSLSIAAFICLMALKLTLISSWLPSMVTDNKGVLAGCSSSLKARKGFGSRFSSYLVTINLLLVINVVCGLCTFGSLLLISLPASYVFILCLQSIFYFEDSGKKYYLSFRKISGADDDAMGD